MTGETQAYELILESVGDLDQQAQIRLKAALIGDLDYSIEDVKRLLAGTSQVIRKATAESELARARELLEQAGAKVKLRRVSQQESHSPEAEDVRDELVVDSESNAGVASEGSSTAPEEPDLDALEQITDLFRDLEESCVIGKGEEVVREIPKSVPLPVPEPEAAVVSPPPGTSQLSGIRRARPSVMEKRFWYRVVSLPELLFSIWFSLLLVLVAFVLYTP